MHCSAINKNTVSALPQIIKYYKENGYTFKIIDESTEEIYKFMKNK
jgi:peptidoglycan/xylan/chitin deacetylase (PgdA/CDA1 family)